MIPPCAQLVLVSLGSAARVTSVTGIPASARQRATVPPATPQPRISTSVSMHALMLPPSWKARVHMTLARRENFGHCREDTLLPSIVALGVVSVAPSSQTENLHISVNHSVILRPRHTTCISC